MPRLKPPSVPPSSRAKLALWLALLVGLTQATPAWALRATQERRQREAELTNALAGLEELRFIPWEGAPDHVLVRPRPAEPVTDNSLVLARYLYEEIHRPIVGAHLRDTYGLDRPPLVLLPEISATLGKPVYLWREGASFPTGSSKPRMLALLFDLYLYGDRHDLTEWDRQQPPAILATQSTGNHGLAMAWFRAALSKAGERLGRDSVTIPDVLIYAMSGIPAIKKKTAMGFGATIVDHFESYEAARLAMVNKAKQEKEHLLYWHHGTWPVILGNMTVAFDLEARISHNQIFDGKRIGIVSAAGAGGRIAGWALGLHQLLPGRVKVIAAQTPGASPVFLAVQQGKPVPITPLAARPVFDGIYVDQMEPKALEIFLRYGDVAAVVEAGDELSFTRWVLEDMKDQDRLPQLTEGVTGVSVAVLFRFPGLFSDVDKIIIDETGVNVDPEDFVKIMGAPLPDAATGGLEEQLVENLGPPAVLPTAEGPTIAGDRALAQNP